MRSITVISIPGLSLLSLCLLGLPLPGQADPVAQVSAVPGKVVLPESTEIKLTLQRDLKSGAEKVGEEVPYQVERDVFSPFPDHVLLLPAGTSAFGKVTRSSRRGLFGKGGKLEFTCDYVRAQDGTHIPLRSAPASEHGRNNIGATVATTLLISPLGLLLNGRDISVHKGKEIVAYVDQSTLLSDPKASIPSHSNLIKTAENAAKTRFTLSDGSQMVGTLLSFDGSQYVVQTLAGQMTVAAPDVISIKAIPAEAPTSPPTLPESPAVPVQKAPK